MTQQERMDAMDDFMAHVSEVTKVIGGTIENLDMGTSKVPEDEPGRKSLDSAAALLVQAKQAVYQAGEIVRKFCNP